VCDELSDSKVIVQPNHDLPAAESRAGPRFSPRSLFIAATAVCILLALLILPAIQAARQATQRATCSRYLQNIGAALHNYHGPRSRTRPLTVLEGSVQGLCGVTRSENGVPGAQGFVGVMTRAHELPAVHALRRDSGGDAQVVEGGSAANRRVFVAGGRRTVGPPSSHPVAG
jgi:hypothetical protein